MSSPLEDKLKELFSEKGLLEGRLAVLKAEIKATQDALYLEQRRAKKATPSPPQSPPAAGKPANVPEETAEKESGKATVGDGQEKMAEKQEGPKSSSSSSEVPPAKRGRPAGSGSRRCLACRYRDEKRPGGAAHTYGDNCDRKGVKPAKSSSE